jgi:hypothetical protein
MIPPTNVKSIKVEGLQSGLQLSPGALEAKLPPCDLDCFGLLGYVYYFGWFGWSEREGVERWGGEGILNDWNK